MEYQWDFFHNSESEFRIVAYSQINRVLLTYCLIHSSQGTRDLTHTEMSNVLYAHEKDAIQIAKLRCAH